MFKRKQKPIPRKPVRAGVVIGSYGMPGVVELGIAAIRDTCGPDTPILVVDDQTPAKEGGERIATIQDRLGVPVIVTDRPYGHAAGDVKVFTHGLEWAACEGLEVLVKFSQRLIITTPGWLQDDAAWLLANGYAAASQKAYHLHMRFPMRTEAVMMAVANAGAVLPFMKAPCITAAEHHIAHAYNVAGLPVGRWPRIPPDRFHPYKGIIWHNTHGADDYKNDGGNAYRMLALKYNIDLGNEFSAAGWHVIAANRPGCNYAHFK